MTFYFVASQCASMQDSARSNVLNTHKQPPAMCSLQMFWRISFPCWLGWTSGNFPGKSCFCAFAIPLLAGLEREGCISECSLHLCNNSWLKGPLCTFMWKWWTLYPYKIQTYVFLINILTLSRSPKPPQKNLKVFNKDYVLASAQSLLLVLIRILGPRASRLRETTELEKGTA